MWQNKIGAAWPPSPLACLLQAPQGLSRPRHSTVLDNMEGKLGLWQPGLSPGSAPHLQRRPGPKGDPQVSSVLEETRRCGVLLSPLAPQL